MKSASGKQPRYITAAVLILLLLGAGALCELFIEGELLSEQAQYILVGISVFCFAGFVLLLIRYFWKAAPGQPESSFYGVVSIVVGLLFWSISIGLGILLIGFLVSLIDPAAAPLLVYALAFTTIILVAVSGAGQIVRRRRMLLILSNLEKASLLNLPMSRMILAAAQGESGVLHQRLMALHDRLDSGEELDQALLHAVPEIPYHIVRAIAAGERMGCLPHVLRGLIRRRSGQYGPLAQTFGLYRAYPVIFFGVLLAILIFVMPKFQSIYHDFQIDIPQPARFLVGLSPDPTFWWFAVALAALVPLGTALQKLFPSFRKSSPFGGAVGDQIIWWMPVAGSYVRDRGMADLCDLTSVGVEMGHPLDQTLRDAASAQPSSIMRRRISAWADAVAHGQPIHQAARMAQFPDLFVAMLATVRDSTGLLQVLGFLWRYYEYRFDRTRTILQAAYVPAIVLVMGSLVALLGVSLLKPMALLSLHIANHISGGS
jgi:type IV pilus assembly protein PilC